MKSSCSQLVVNWMLCSALFLIHNPEDMNRKERMRSIRSKRGAMSSLFFMGFPILDKVPTLYCIMYT